MGKKDISYNGAIAEIEAILEKLSKGEIDIDMLAVEVKRATELIGICRSKLRKTEQDVEKALNPEKER